MILITGGAYQGKTEYVKKQYGLSENSMIRGGEIAVLPDKIGCISEYHLFIRRQIKDNADPIETAKKLDADIVIMDEIGCGIIPIKKEERIWREQVGMAGCILAERADKVIRITCGIPQTIKETL